MEACETLGHAAMSRDMEDTMRSLADNVIESCARAIENIPASVSLYENERVAKAVISFKKEALGEIRRLKFAKMPNPQA